MKTSDECFEVSDTLARQARGRLDPTFGELALAWRLVGQWAALDELMVETDGPPNDGRA